MRAWDEIKDFWEYVEFYPYRCEKDYDGIHDGGIKGVRADAPESAKKAYAKWAKEEEENRKLGLRV